MINVILYSLIIFAVASSPFPSLPIIFLSYKMNGLLGGYISVLVGGHFASLLYFYLSRKLSRGLIKVRYPRIYSKIEKYSKLLNRINYPEFFLLVLSGIVPSSILSISAGVSKLSFKTFFFTKLVISIPQQLFYTALATQYKTIDFIFFKIGLEKYNNLVTSTTLLSLITIFILFIIKILNNLLKKSNKYKIFYLNKRE